MREIGKGGFEGIKKLIEQNFIYDTDIFRVLSQQYNLKHENLYDNGKSLFSATLLRRLFTIFK